MATGPEVIDAYFGAIPARDATAVGACFTDDAILISAAGTRRQPGRRGDRTPHGWTSDGVADVFTLAGNRIARVAIYTGTPVS